MHYGAIIGAALSPSLPLSPLTPKGPMKTLNLLVCNCFQDVNFMFALKLSCKLFSACIGVIGLCCSSFLWELILYFTWKNIENAFDGILEVIVGSLVGVDSFKFSALSC